MPRYELALILKAMQRPETAAVLKRTVEALMERGAIVRNLENLGERALPYKISKHNHRHRRGGKDAAHQPSQCSNLVPFVNWYSAVVFPFCFVPCIFW
ncbi:28S ribosomal protein S6, mitochondrial isoform 2 [Gallus gallus]|uniref:Small ribosomal subunit protein bS6m n=1 Tax=Gallus gallus TaxID=9031 RepID=A0A8V0YGC0_CHICK|nr:small ribosomal subunit protein bS6m isoform 2 [Gallus gallus]